MARRWADPAAFRPDPLANASRPTSRQTIAMVAVLLLVAGAVTAMSLLVRPDRARSFDLQHGSVLIGDQLGPVSIDLGSGTPTLQLRGADQQAGVTAPGELALVPFDDGTMLLNTRSGEFNMVDTTGFVEKRDGGVSIGGRTGNSQATGIAAGPLAYIERTGSAGTDVLLVGPATVQAATVNPKSVKPRASYGTADQAVVTTGGAASANGNLWTLFRRSGSNDLRLRLLTVPADSSTGAALKVTNYGTVDALSSVESATESDDATANSSDTGSDGDTGSNGTDAVGVASPGSIRVIGPNLSSRTVGYRTPAGLDDIVATSSAQGRLSWLLHGSDGWSVVSVRTDGSGLVGPMSLGTIDPTATLAPPAQSSGGLYTMVRSGSLGTIYRVDFNGKVTAVRAAYPQSIGANGRSNESASFADGYVIARDSRVIVDSPTHLFALAVFTDGSQAPFVIRKTNVTTVNATSGPETLAKAQVTTKPTKPRPGKSGTQVVTTPAINNQITCEQLNQKPLVPTIVGAMPSARSIALSWSYPIVSSQACNPSTYVVSVKLISNGAPQAPGSVTLQDQLDTVIGGLYPSTQYEFTVTAFINGQSTSSQPVRITTGPEGPAAPTGIKVTADSSGNWDLSWNGCGSISSTCVPVASWTIQPSYCDNGGLSASPAAVTVAGDPTSVRQPPAVYTGGGSLLGRALRFTIQGTSADGTSGTVSASSACVQSWTPPAADNITLAASVPPQTGSASDTTATTASLSFADGAQHDLGGTGATITYELLQGTKVVTTVGPTQNTTARLGGVQPGLDYQVAATITPPGHPAAAITIGPVGVTRATSAWPAISFGDTPYSTNDGAASADVSFTLSGLSSASSAGETFDIGYSVKCGSSATETQTAKAVDPAQPITFKGVSRLTINGSDCQVIVSSIQETGSSGVYGGTPYPGTPTSAVFSIDAPTLTGLSSGDFTAAWGGAAGKLSQVSVAYTGSDPVITAGLGKWSVSVTDPDGTTCGGYSNHAKLDSLSVTDACVQADGASGDDWTVSFTYTYLLGSEQQTITGITGGKAPTYNPPVCDPSATNLTATWGGSMDAPTVTVAADGTQDCTSWSYVLVAPATPTCATASGPPPQTIAIPATCTDTPAATGWSVTVGYTDLSGNPQTLTLQVTGDPPS